MQFLLLIYEDEKRFNGLRQADFASELDEYRAFGREFPDHDLLVARALKTDQPRRNQ